MALTSPQQSIYEKLIRKEIKALPTKIGSFNGSNPEYYKFEFANLIRCLKKDKNKEKPVKTSEELKKV